MNPIISTEGLTHIYSVGTPFEHTAIDNIDFAAYPGEYLGIIGHTGSGKSTFIQHLNGLLKPTSGVIKLDGADIHSSKKFTHEVRFQVGLVFQYPEYQLFEETVYKDIAFGPKNMKLSAEEIDRRVRTASELVGISADMLEKSPFNLSGGQKRRVAIAGVMAMQPKVLILDEPTAGLDPEGRDEIIDNINNYRRITGTTVIMVSHSMEETAKNVDRLFVFHDGKIDMHGTPPEVFSHSERLEEIGLTVPKVTKVAMRLRQMGLELPRDIYTTEQLKAALLKLKGGVADA